MPSSAVRLGRLAAAIAAATAFACGAPPAGARDAPFRPDQVELARALEAADDFWRDDPQNHCLGRNGATIDDVFPERHSTAAGYSRNGECGSIHLLRSRIAGYTRWQFCTLVVHEYGHTIDYVHVDDPSDIMYPKPVTAGLHPPICDYPDPHAVELGEAASGPAREWAWSFEFGPSDWR